MMEILVAALGGAVEIASTLKRAMDAARAGDEAEALRLVDEALARNAAAVGDLGAALDAVRARVVAEIEAGSV